MRDQRHNITTAGASPHGPRAPTSRDQRTNISRRATYCERSPPSHHVIAAPTARDHRTDMQGPAE